MRHENQAELWLNHIGYYVIPIARTKAQELLLTITAMANGVSKPSEFTLAALRREAKNSLQTDAYNGYMALGALAALTWNDQGLDENHRLSIALGDNELSHRNYAVSLDAVMRYADAADEMLIASNLHPENITSLIKAFFYAFYAGRLGEAMTLREKLEKRSPESLNQIFDIEGVIHVLNGIDGGEEEFRHGMKIVFDTLRRHHIKPNTIGTRIDRDVSDPSVLLEFYIDTPIQNAQSIHAEVCSRLCEELPDGGHPSVLMFGIVGTGA
jgi:hypothetical protein